MSRCRHSLLWRCLLLAETLQFDHHALGLLPLWDAPSWWLNWHSWPGTTGLKGAFVALHSLALMECAPWPVDPPARSIFSVWACMHGVRSGADRSGCCPMPPCGTGPIPHALSAVLDADH